MGLLPVLDGGFGDHPDAVRVAGAALSWAELRGAATAVADRIAGARTVAVDATASLETVAVVVGGLVAGVPVVPIPPDAGPRERDHILRDCRADLLLTSSASDHPTGLDGGHSTGLVGGRLAGAPPEADATRPAVVPVELARRSDVRYPEPDGASPALILYTSGTTGPPKGAVLSRDAIAADLDALADAWAWTPSDTLVHGLPLYHVHGLVLGVLGALRVGCRLVHTVRPAPAGYAAAGGTLYFGVPTVWSRVCREPSTARALASARLLVSGSAPLPLPVYESLAALTGHEPVERYGMTETLITVSARADGPRRAGRVGVPVRGVETRLVEAPGGGHTTALADPPPAPGGSPPVPGGSTSVPGGGMSLVLADGETLGELQVRGSTLFDGYLGLPEATARGYTGDGWFRTGDVATIDPDGTHRIVGRASQDLIKTGGFRVGAGEVEDALLAHPAVREAAVVGVPDDDLGQRIVGYVVADAVSPATLIDFVAGTLAAHKRPRQIVILDALPRNAMGKLQKHLLGR